MGDAIEKIIFSIIVVVYGYATTLGIKGARDFVDQFDYKEVAGIVITTILCGMYIGLLLDHDNNLLLIFFTVLLIFIVIFYFFILKVKSSILKNKKYSMNKWKKRLCLCISSSTLVGYGLFLYGITKEPDWMLQSYKWIFLSLIILLYVGFILGLAFLYDLKRFKFCSYPNKPFFNKKEILIGYKVDENGDYLVIKMDEDSDYRLVQIARSQVAIMFLENN